MNVNKSLLNYLNKMAEELAKDYANYANQLDIVKEVINLLLIQMNLKNKTFLIPSDNTHTK